MASTSTSTSDFSFDPIEEALEAFGKGERGGLVYRRERDYDGEDGFLHSTY
jgi:hypothetical protein